MAKQKASNSPASDHEPADELERVIAHLDTLYEQGLDCIHPDTEIIVSDGEYDQLRKDLFELRPESTIFDTATASSLVSPSKKVVHDPPMTSIEKASHEDIEKQEQQLFHWLTKTVNALDVDSNQPRIVITEKLFKDVPVSYVAGSFFQAYKLDGVAIAVYYENGNLARAGLRPRDGINGEDVTEQVQYVSGIPQRLPESITCSIRGELICKLSDFELVQQALDNAGEKLRANPRNHSAGGIRQFKNPKKTESMRLSFIAYGIDGQENPPYRTELERAKWCTDLLGVPYQTPTPFQFERLGEMESAIPTLDFEVDGIVIGVNNLQEQHQLGRHGDPLTGNPKGKIAWKFKEEEATPVIKEIQWQTGRTGKLTAVAIFDSVRLAGTNVSRATLHNAGFMERKRITVGSKIAVRKAGKIIPKVTRVISGQGTPNFPGLCPSCGAPTRLRKGAPRKEGADEMLELVCNNPDCPAQNIHTLCHFLATIGVLGLGEARIRQLVEGAAVTVPVDFYRLDVERAMTCGLTVRQATLAVAAIHMIPSPDKLDLEQLDAAIIVAMQSRRKVPLSQLFAAFGIGAAGKAAGKALASHFGSLKKIRSAAIDELESVDDIGKITAVAIRDYFDTNTDAIDSLLDFVEPIPPSATEGPLSGKTFCFSGGFPDGKTYWEKQVESRGGKCSNSVSKKTNYLVAGTGSGSKSDKAKKLGIPIISTDELAKMF